MTTREIVTTSIYQQPDWGRRHSNHKFLSIKSIIRNKKIVVKKSMPNCVFHPPPNILEDQTRLIDEDICRKTQPSSSNNNNKNIVNIQFSENHSMPNKNSSAGGFNQELKTRKRIMMQNLLMDENRRMHRNWSRQRPSSSFTETLVIEPLQKNSEAGLVPVEKKKNSHFQQIQYLSVSKKSGHKDLPKDNFETYRTLSSLKPVGKQIIIIKGNSGNKNYHRTTTAMGRKQVSFSRQGRIKKRGGTGTESRQNWGLEGSQIHFCYGLQKESKEEMSSSLIFDSKIQGQKQEEEEEKYLYQEMERQKQLQNLQKEAQREKQKLINEAIMNQFKDFLPLRKPVVRKDYFVFGMSDKPSNESENKIQLYRDYLWKINYSNSLYVCTPDNLDYCYKAYFGFGNNSCMLKSIMRRRFWWTITDSSQGCQFVWTQLKINSLFKSQICREEPRYYNEENRQENENKYQEIRDKNVFLKSCMSEEEFSPLSYQIAHSKIFNFKDWKQFEKHQKKYRKSEQKITEQTYMKRLNLYGKKQIAKIGDSNKIKMHNHLQFNFYLGNKKALFYNIRRLCQCKGVDPFQYIPLTFHVSKGISDPVYEEFLKHFSKFQQYKKNDKAFKNMWIAKPGQNTNRGNGISVCFGIDDIRLRLRGREKNGDGKPRTFILQKYIERPFLYKNRKFDIRHYILLTSFNGAVKAYWFDEGYVRTSSSQFNLKNNKDVFVHLTNDAVQKHSEGYGKHEKGNKVSYEEFQKYLDTNFKKKKYDFFGKTLKKMKQIALLAVEATYSLLDPKRKQHNFELIGLDFMLDETFKPWLIEANTNPCLELSCPLLEKLIPTLIEQTFRICIDPFFPPPQNFTNKKQFFGENPLLQNKFELIFDEVVDGQKIQQLFKKGIEKSEEFNNAIGKIEEDDETFEDDGNDKWEQKQKNS